MVDPDNIFYENTPIDIQDEYHNFIVNYLNENFNLSRNDFIYLKFSNIFNIPGKGYFNVKIKNKKESIKAIDNEPDFLIFIQ
jgi:hypothetical protein